MDPIRAALASAVNRTTRSLENLYPYMNEAGRAYLECTDRYAGYLFVYRQSAFRKRLAADLVTHSPKKIEQEYWCITHHLFAAALTVGTKKAVETLSVYKANVGKHQDPKSRFPECNRMRGVLEAEFYVNDAGERARELGLLRDKPEKSWEELVESYRSLIESIIPLYKEMNDNLADLNKSIREQTRVRNSYIAICLTSITLLIAGITAWSEFGP